MELRLIEKEQVKLYFQMLSLKKNSSTYRCKRLRKLTQITYFLNSFDSFY